MRPHSSLNATPVLFPVLAGLVLLLLFSALGFWQLDRAAQKREVLESFDADGEYVVLADDASYKMYQRVTVSGRYLNERQFLLENIVLDGQIGYYVITPFEYAPDKPLLLVNRGWLAKRTDEDGSPPIAVSDRAQSISGRVGRLPRVGIRPGPAFERSSGWPRRAVWPELVELGGELGHEVLPFVLLADPDPASNLLRRWQPQQIGPMRHIGYAVQWFALALAVLVTGIILYRRKKAAK